MDTGQAEHFATAKALIGLVQAKLSHGKPYLEFGYEARLAPAVSGLNDRT